MASIGQKRTVGLHILPSSMTVLALCAGLTAIKFALDEQPHIAMALIVAAAILDGLDGRVARILDAESRMGEQIDSLADAVDFGVAPAVVVYVSMLSHVSAGWIVVLLYAVCVVLRLARFNALLDETGLPAYTREFFVGMPSPAGALALLALLAARLQFGEGWWTTQWFTCAYVVLVALLLVSRIPMKKMHAISVPPHLAALLLAGLALVAAAAFLFPYILIIVFVIAYLAHVTFAIRSQRWVAAHPEAWEEHAKQRRAIRRAIRRERRTQPYRRSMARLRLRKPGTGQPSDTDGAGRWGV